MQRLAIEDIAQRGHLILLQRYRYFYSDRRLEDSVWLILKGKDKLEEARGHCTLTSYSSSAVKAATKSLVQPHTYSSKLRISLSRRFRARIGRSIPKTSRHSSPERASRNPFRVFALFPSNVPERAVHKSRNGPPGTRLYSISFSTSH